ncbi:nitronate monooxygenase [Bacillus inaquosorum]|uniref:NAD(P)H-dependent flavin oxidoreductase n=1 Tax=Bacillus inaquosorum TaxID=483913 RepID=UPI00227E0BAB|nr:nitronate monooxygenase [Bacillus inaquosorum]MCY7766797.1 nitronate monooxygenase [Bacillus inaquosorum]MCY7821187.1 nitronate monooxygenase [Bacillus inaquosorum]MCY7937254.1 nitronate monooxygenase [Bacillus inaquosorum]MCY7952875.1 nitronate monooxygenase [Bacillus inaquosorum]MCY8279084.1 nitronate monooxygenase [Bacillus inaquosorum]
MKNRITKLFNIDYPIISAAMTWVTSAEFVAAVSNAGGMGVLGPNAGQAEKSSSPEDTAERLRKEIQKVKQLTEKPFAVNYIFPMGDNKENPFTNAIFDVLVEQKVKTVVAVGQKVIQKEVSRLKEHNINIIYRDLSPTAQKLVEAEKSGVDALIATGYEAGGHMSDYKISTLSIVPQVTSLVEIPVIAAGGIIDGKGAQAAFAMGAEGVYMGTRFIATKENPASDATKQAILKVNSEEFIEFKSRIGNLRTIPTEAGIKALDLIKQGKLDEAYAYYGNGFKIGMLDGDLVNGTISVSEAAGGIKEIKTCAEVINEIMSTLEK